MKNIVGNKMAKGAVKALSLIGLGLGLMGNQSCEQKPVVEEKRQLKWYADAGAVQSQPVSFGNAGSFDFGYVASEQLQGVLFNSKGFTTSYSGPSIESGSSGLELATAQGMYQKMFGTKVIGKALSYSDEARCLITLPDVRVSGSVLSYELTSGNNISLGFNQNTVHTGLGLGGQFNVKLKQLSMQLYGLDSAKDLYNGKQRLIAAPLVTEQGKETDGNVNVSFNQIGLGYGWYKNTPLAKLTEGALQKGVDQIKTEMNKVKWTTKVLDLQPFEEGSNNPIGDLGVVVKGGADVNLKVGDQLSFYNEKTLWKDKPCESDYYGFARFSTTPIAHGKVVHVDRYFSTVAITQRFETTKILPGWRVELLKSVEDAAAEEAATAKTTSQKKK